MKHTPFIAVVMVVVMGIGMNQALFAQTPMEDASQLYAAGNYAEAEQIYKSILQAEGNELLSAKSRSVVYYNLGNACFKQGKLSAAILSYERSLRANPRNKDAQFNLEFARTQIIDNIEDNQAFFFATWAQNLRNYWSVSGWRILSIVCFILCLTGILVFTISHTIIVRKIAFHSAWIVLIVCIIAGLNASSLHKRDSLRNEAIITQGVLNAKSSPDASGTDLFTLHEGTKVEIKETLGEWGNIRVGNNEGWILLTNMERI